MDDEISLSVSFPLDSDGFLRRCCPTCDREFKWSAANESGEELVDDADDVDDAGYFCPYCGIQAETADWLTEAQADLVTATVEREVLGPLADEFGQSLSELNRASGGLIRAEVSGLDSDEPIDPLPDEEDDMRKVVSPCHPEEPLKVLDSWTKTTYCLVCGSLSP